MLSGLDAGSITSICLAVAATFLSIVGALVALVFNGLREDIRINTQHIDQNARHLDSIMATMWSVIWRLSSIEDFMADKHGYRPPPMIPRQPPNLWGDDPPDR